MTRRDFLAGSAAAAAVGGLAVATPGLAIAPLQRLNPVLKGISLSAYSMRESMKYMRGKPHKGTMEMSGFLDYCAELGVDGAELTAYFFSEAPPVSELNGLKRQAHLLGLDLTSGAIGNNFSHAPGSEEARLQLAYTRTWVDRYADLGIPVIRVFAGNPAQGMEPGEAIAHMVANLREALVHAGERGVMLAVENHDFASRVDRLLEVVRQVDSPWFGVMLDSGNLAPTPDPYAELARLVPYALMAQVKVEIPVNGRNEPADFKRLAGVLRDGGYGGYLVLEYEAAEDPRRAIPRYVEALRKVIG